MMLDIFFDIEVRFFDISDFVLKFQILSIIFEICFEISYLFAQFQIFSDFALKSDFHRNFRSLCCIRASEIAHIFQIFMWRRVGISDLLLKFEKNQICSVKFSIWDNILHFSLNFRFFWFCFKQNPMFIVSLGVLGALEQARLLRYFIFPCEAVSEFRISQWNLKISDLLRTICDLCSRFCKFRTFVFVFYLNFEMLRFVWWAQNIPCCNWASDTAQIFHIFMWMRAGIWHF